MSPFAGVRWDTTSAILEGMPRFERSLFDGQWSRLNLSIESILSDFQTGHIEAAALITDLMATGDIIGPLAVSNALSDWLASNDVRSAIFHVGLLAARADYRGLATGRLLRENQ